MPIAKVTPPQGVRYYSIEFYNDFGIQDYYNFEQRKPSSIPVQIVDEMRVFFSNDLLGFSMKTQEIPFHTRAIIPQVPGYIYFLISKEYVNEDLYEYTYVVDAKSSIGDELLDLWVERVSLGEACGIQSLDNPYPTAPVGAKINMPLTSAQLPNKTYYICNPTGDATGFPKTKIDGTDQSYNYSIIVGEAKPVRSAQITINSLKNFNMKDMEFEVEISPNPVGIPAGKYKSTPAGTDKTANFKYSSGNNTTGNIQVGVFAGETILTHTEHFSQPTNDTSDLKEVMKNNFSLKYSGQSSGQFLINISDFDITMNLTVSGTLTDNTLTDITVAAQNFGFLNVSRLVYSEWDYNSQVSKYGTLSSLYIKSAKITTNIGTYTFLKDKVSASASFGNTVPEDIDKAMITKLTSDKMDVLAVHIGHILNPTMGTYTPASSNSYTYVSKAGFVEINLKDMITQQYQDQLKRGIDITLSYFGAEVSLPAKYMNLDGTWTTGEDVKIKVTQVLGIDSSIISITLVGLFGNNSMEYIGKGTYQAGKMFNITAAQKWLLDNPQAQAIKDQSNALEKQQYEINKKYKNLNFGLGTAAQVWGAGGSIAAGFMKGAGTGAAMAASGEGIKLANSITGHITSLMKMKEELNYNIERREKEFALNKAAATSGRTTLKGDSTSLALLNIEYAGFYALLEDYADGNIGSFCDNWGYKLQTPLKQLVDKLKSEGYMTITPLPLSGLTSQEYNLLCSQLSFFYENLTADTLFPGRPTQGYIVHNGRTLVEFRYYSFLQNEFYNSTVVNSGPKDFEKLNGTIDNFKTDSTKILVYGDKSLWDPANETAYTFASIIVQDNDGTVYIKSLDLPQNTSLGDITGQEYTNFYTFKDSLGFENKMLYCDVSQINFEDFAKLVNYFAEADKEFQLLKPKSNTWDLPTIPYYVFNNLSVTPIISRATVMSDLYSPELFKTTPFPTSVSYPNLALKFEIKRLSNNGGYLEIFCSYDIGDDYKNVMTILPDEYINSQKNLTAIFQFYQDTVDKASLKYFGYIKGKDLISTPSNPRENTYKTILIPCVASYEDSLGKAFAIAPLIEGDQVSISVPIYTLDDGNYLNTGLDLNFLTNVLSFQADTWYQNTADSSIRFFYDSALDALQIQGSSAASRMLSEGEYEISTASWVPVQLCSKLFDAELEMNTGDLRDITFTRAQTSVKVSTGDFTGFPPTTIKIQAWSEAPYSSSNILDFNKNVCAMTYDKNSTYGAVAVKSTGNTGDILYSNLYKSKAQNHILISDGGSTSTSSHVICLAEYTGYPIIDNIPLWYNKGTTNCYLDYTLPYQDGDIVLIDNCFKSFCIEGVNLYPIVHEAVDSSQRYTHTLATGMPSDVTLTGTFPNGDARWNIRVDYDSELESGGYLRIFNIWTFSNTRKVDEVPYLYENSDKGTIITLMSFSDFDPNKTGGALEDYLFFPESYSNYSDNNYTKLAIPVNVGGSSSNITYKAIRHGVGKVHGTGSSSDVFVCEYLALPCKDPSQTIFLPSSYIADGIQLTSKPAWVKFDQWYASSKNSDQLFMIDSNLIYHFKCKPTQYDVLTITDYWIESSVDSLSCVLLNDYSFSSSDADILKDCIKYDDSTTTTIKNLVAAKNVPASVTDTSGVEHLVSTYTTPFEWKNTSFNYYLYNPAEDKIVGVLKKDSASSSKKLNLVLNMPYGLKAGEVISSGVSEVIEPALSLAVFVANGFGDSLFMKSTSSFYNYNPTNIVTSYGPAPSISNTGIKVGNVYFFTSPFKCAVSFNSTYSMLYTGDLGSSKNMPYTCWVPTDGGTTLTKIDSLPIGTIITVPTSPGGTISFGVTTEQNYPMSIDTGSDTLHGEDTFEFVYYNTIGNWAKESSTDVLFLVSEYDSLLAYTSDPVNNPTQMEVIRNFQGKLNTAVLAAKEIVDINGANPIYVGVNRAFTAVMIPDKIATYHLSDFPDWILHLEDDPRIINIDTNAGTVEFQCNELEYRVYNIKIK